MDDPGMAGRQHGKPGVPRQWRLVGFVSDDIAKEFAA
jgi:hypothetical protein